MINDSVVLADADGRPCGTADREAVHGVDTPLHFAFSCHLVDADNRILMTRRALSKRSWPGVWTNSFCGHPRPGEAVVDAVHRYAQRELGIDVDEVRCVLPDFRYRAVDASGIVENEICPVFVARPLGSLEPNPDEVAEYAWADVPDVWDLVSRTPWAVSPWFADQVRQMPGPDPHGLAADPAVVVTHPTTVRVSNS
ncbi:isopentenyl-diphosphate Delta-isomerase [Gordonia namibiensis NBRC 108229]|uniref:Isopentenyl-diphosphate Delta-isomerase n=1 Tax=Gordonia namibiensis NBRC 108229 TaxID=1208314 RepID=K6XDW6_9ACTN|nr:MULTISPECIES: isopentenyl-diphosphate Delta-isomerase [Gordonia]MCK8615982.1 isopentenyl-diphosphate Delta-isomerase [Gordonia sp. C13]GAC02578.1 isopentenyl-diphosphate Delta-isomerase [Gordonia namibiensis NBRC 108229]